MPYDVTTDPTAFYIFDPRSVVTVSGSQVTGVSNVSASGKSYAMATDYGTAITVGSVNGAPTLHYGGGAGLKIATSTALDAEFTNSGNSPSGGWGVFAIFREANGTYGGGWIVSKGPDAGNTVNVNLTCVNPSGGANQIGQFTAVGSYRPYTPGAVVSAALSAYVGTSRSGGPANYADGTQVSYQGVPCNRGSVTNPGGSDGVGYDLRVGGAPWGTGLFALQGDLCVLVLWNRTPLPHEILATHRRYAPTFGIAETLTDQPYALVVEGNSELAGVVPGPAEIGIVDRVANALGLGLGACWNLARPSRSGGDIAADYATVTAPLLAELAALGVERIAVELEGINDAWGLTAATNYRNYALSLPAGVPYVPCTLFAADQGTGPITPANGATGTNAISTMRAQVLADATAHGWYVADLGNTSGLAIYDAGNYTDGVHLSAAGVALVYPVIVSAVGAAAPNAFLPSVIRSRRTLFTGRAGSRGVA